MILLCVGPLPCGGPLLCGGPFLWADDPVAGRTVGNSNRGDLSAVPVGQSTTDQVPLVIAHRGASGYLPEHTTEAAAFAHALGADYIEQDVVLSKDGVAVVLHDITLNSVTNVADVFPGRDRDGEFFVFDFTLAELRQLNIMERFADASRRRFPGSSGRFRIATLAEHIELIQGLNHSRHRNTGLYVEIKQPARHRLQKLDPSRAVLRILAEYGYKQADSRVFVQCFEESETRRIRIELKCRLPLIQLYADLPTEQEIADISGVVNGLGVPISTVVSGVTDQQPQITSLVRTARQHALQVHVWTFRTDDLPKYAPSADLLLQWLVRDGGVDGIFADQPDVVLAWRRTAYGQVRPNGPFHLLQGGKPQKSSD
ncbi:MAG: glycerophosphodiester phosphodiesterase family protein [Fuerstiella sp.]